MSEPGEIVVREVLHRVPVDGYIFCLYEPEMYEGGFGHRRKAYPYTVKTSFGTVQGWVDQHTFLSGNADTFLSDQVVPMLREREDEE